MRWFRLLGLFIALAGFLGIVVVLRSCSVELADGPFRRRYGPRPPEQAFEFAFKQPVPPGVTHLRATGESWLAGVNVWLVFQAPRSVVERLVKANAANTPGALEWGVKLQQQLRESGQIGDAMRIHYDPADRVGWRTLYQAQHADITAFGNPNLHTSIYYVRETGTAYVFVYGI